MNKNINHINAFGAVYTNNQIDEEKDEKLSTQTKTALIVLCEILMINVYFIDQK